MDGEWLMWRHLDGYWEEFEDKGWRMGLVKSAPLPPVFAESGSCRISFCRWDWEKDLGLFELCEMRGEDRLKVALVWGVPTPCEAAELLERFGVEERRTGRGREDMPVLHAGG